MNGAAAVSPVLSGAGLVLALGGVSAALGVSPVIWPGAAILVIWVMRHGTSPLPGMVAAEAVIAALTTLSAGAETALLAALSRGALAACIGLLVAWRPRVPFDHLQHTGIWLATVALVPGLLATLLWWATGLGATGPAVALAILCLVPGALRAWENVPVVSWLYASATLALGLATLGLPPAVPAILVPAVLILAHVAAPAFGMGLALFGLGLGAALGQIGLGPADPMAPLLLCCAAATGLLACAALQELHLRQRDLQDQVHRRTQRVRYLLNTRDEVTALAVHDLQSPIQAIGGIQHTLLHVMSSDNYDRDAVRHALQSASETCDDLSRRVESVLSQKRAHLGGVSARQPLSDVLDEVAAAHAIDIGRHNITLRKTADPSLTVSDVEEIKDILDVFLDNALRHSPQNGTIQLTAQRQPDGAILIEIADQGPGVPANRSETLFNLETPQVDTRSRQGMGLFLAYRRAKSIGGTVSHHPGRGGGAVFQLVLPQA